MTPRKPTWEEKEQAVVFGPRAEAFKKEYTDALTRAVIAKPEEYDYTVEQVPRVVEKMMRPLAVGGATLSSPIKAAARKCGCNPTVAAIKTFLTE